jgi:hypothetical protein
MNDEKTTLNYKGKEEMTESSSKGYKKTNAGQKQGAKNQIRR